MGFWSGLWDKFQPNELRKLNGSFFYVFGGDSASELDFKVLYKVYQKVPHLRAVIDQKSWMFSNARLQVKKRDSEDEILYEHPLQKLLDKPNAFQSTREWLFMIMAYKCISADAFVYKNYVVGDKLRNLVSLTPIDYSAMKINTRRDVQAFEVTDVEDMVKNIQFTFNNGTSRVFKDTDLKSLIYFRDTGIKFTDACSKIITLKDAIINIHEAMKARQTMIKKKGGIGALTGNQKDAGNALPMSKKEKESIQERLDSFGLGSGKDPIIVTDVPMRWTPFVFPTRELMLFEEIEDAFHQICDGYGIRREIFEGQSTYANKEHAERGTYQDTIIPEWEDLAKKLNAGLQTEKEGVEIVVDYSHIAILQENEKEKVDVQSVKSGMLINELNNNLITREDYRDQMGYEGPPPPEKVDEGAVTDSEESGS